MLGRGIERGKVITLIGEINQFNKNTKRDFPRRNNTRLAYSRNRYRRNKVLIADKIHNNSISKIIKFKKKLSRRLISTLRLIPT